MILVCRDCGATVKFGENCGCGGIVELSKTQMDDLLLRAWSVQTKSYEFPQMSLGLLRKMRQAGRQFARAAPLRKVLYDRDGCCICCNRASVGFSRRQEQ